jgi:hypothetical protein
MTQRMCGGHRDLSSLVAPQALISVCHSIVPSVDEIPLVDISPWAGRPTRRG